MGTVLQALITIIFFKRILSLARMQSLKEIYSLR